MRRLLALLLALVAAIAGGSVVATAGPVAAQVPADDPRLGLVYDGLRRASSGSLCGGAFESVLDVRASPWMKQVLCTHGPDPAPDDVDVRDDRGPDPAAAAGTAAEAGPVPCYGDGTDGFRVQLLYARGVSSPDRFADYSSSFGSWAGRLDQVVDNSAAETGGSRHVRFVTDPACNPVVDRVALSSGAMSSFTTMVSELRSKGYGRTDRKYLVWADANVYCGISELYVDDSADPTPGRNYNNGNAQIQGPIGRVDNGCWGRPNLTEAHELLHLLGGVQPTAPNATPGYHCTDESDRLCYADGSTSAAVRQVCPAAHEALYDCNHDDYFSTAPSVGSYLSTHWNTADSAFLSAQGPTTPVTTPPGPTTTTTTTTSTTTTSTTTATTTATTTPVPTATPIIRRWGSSPPSAPRALGATQPAVGPGVQLAWQPPAIGLVGGYRVYRGTSPVDQSLLATLPNVGGYTDASAGPTLYFYRVTAFNGVGDGPSSAVVGMIGKAGFPAERVRQLVGTAAFMPQPP